MNVNYWSMRRGFGSIYRYCGWFGVFYKNIIFDVRDWVWFCKVLLGFCVGCVVCLIC